MRVRRSSNPDRSTSIRSSWTRLRGESTPSPLSEKRSGNLSLEDTVVPIVSRSAVVARFWTTPLSLIFIDGGHTFEAAFTDYSAWVSHLLPGGYLVIHDIFPDPTKGGQAPRCVYGMALDSGLFEELPHDGNAGRSAEGLCRRRALLTDRIKNPHGADIFRGSIPDFHRRDAVENGRRGCCASSASGILRRRSRRGCNPFSTNPRIVRRISSPSTPVAFSIRRQSSSWRSSVLSVESGAGMAPHFSIRSSDSRR